LIYFCKTQELAVPQLALLETIAAELLVPRQHVTSLTKNAAQRALSGHEVIIIAM
jgi:hypothetical protein